MMAALLLAQATILAQARNPEAPAWGWGWVLGAVIVAVLALLGVFVGQFGEDARSGRPR